MKCWPSGDTRRPVACSGAGPVGDPLQSRGALNERGHRCASADHARRDARRRETRPQRRRGRASRRKRPALVAWNRDAIVRLRVRPERRSRPGPVAASRWSVSRFEASSAPASQTIAVVRARTTGSRAGRRDAVTGRQRQAWNKAPRASARTAGLEIEGCEIHGAPANVARASTSAPSPAASVAPGDGRMAVSTPSAVSVGDWKTRPAAASDALSATLITHGVASPGVAGTRRWSTRSSVACTRATSSRRSGIDRTRPSAPTIVRTVWPDAPAAIRNSRTSAYENDCAVFADAASATVPEPCPHGRRPDGARDRARW